MNSFLSRSVGYRENMTHIHLGYGPVDSLSQCPIKKESTILVNSIKEPYHFDQHMLWLLNYDNTNKPNLGLFFFSQNLTWLPCSRFCAVFLQKSPLFMQNLLSHSHQLVTDLHNQATPLSMVVIPLIHLQPCPTLLEGLQECPCLCQVCSYARPNPVCLTV